MKFFFTMALLALVSCGGATGTLTVTLVTPVGADPFASASQARITVSSGVADAAPISQTTVAVTGGHFSDAATIDLGANAGLAALVTVEALAADGSVIGRGATPLLGILPTAEDVAVWVGAPGTVGRSPSSLKASPVVGAAIAMVPRMGVVIAGGTSGGQPSASVDIYEQYLQATVTPVASLPTARAGAIAIGFDRPADLGGALLAIGGGSADGAILDPTTSSDGTTTGIWTTVLSDPSLGRAWGSAAQLASGGWLVTGGLDANGKALDTATLLTLGDAPANAPLHTALVGARSGHTTIAGTFLGEAGALLVGGGAPQVERFSATTSTFSALPGGDPLPADASAFSATALPDGRVLLVGGLVNATPSQGGALIDPKTLAVTPLPTVLPTARAGHVAFVAAGELVVCGGRDGSNNPIASCDVLDGASLHPVRTVALAVGRSALSAITLDNSDVLLLGGDDANTATAIDVYTPLH